MGNATSGLSAEHGRRSDTFPGSSLLDSATTMCGNMNHADASPGASKSNGKNSVLAQANGLCAETPPQSPDAERMMNKDAEKPMNPTSALFARALVSEVTDNPKTMTPAQMAEREKALLKAQQAAKKGGRAVGAAGQPAVLHSLAHALGSKDERPAQKSKEIVVPPNSIQENRAQVSGTQAHGQKPLGKHSVTIGLSLSRRHSALGHLDTVTRQTAFDFNELQDREYKYVSSTDASGWRAGGGERGESGLTNSEENGSTNLHKVAAPDTVHIPIIQIDAESSAIVDGIISALARGEVFIPHMAILPEALSVNGISPPDLVVRFGCERNEDIPPDEWPNWCLEFMHNQLYEYFQNVGAQWTQRPFQITLAKKVRWKTVKHMNRYFAHAERVLDAWREKGPQYLDPQLSYIEGGATPEEVARPHGIYLMRNGIPTNYFAPNFEPPYTTKMTRSLLLNVLDKSWEKKRREWTSEPVPRLVTPATLMATMCGCADPSQGGFVASEVTSTLIRQKSHTGVLAEANAALYQQDQDLDHALEKVRSNESSVLLLNPIEKERLDSFHGDAIDEGDEEHTQDDYKAEEDEFRTNELGSPAENESFSRKHKDRKSAASPRYGRSPTPEMISKKSETVNENGTKSYSQHSNIEESHSQDELAAELEEAQRKYEEEDARLEKQLMDVKEILTKADVSATSKSVSSTSNSKSTKSRKSRRKLIAEIASQKSPSNKTPASVENGVKDPNKAGLTKSISDRHMNGDAQKHDVPEVMRNNSGTSLEYSIDSSMLGDSSTLAGQYFAADGSVATTGSRRKYSQAKTTSSMASQPEEDETAHDEDEEEVPSDEALFEVGWAKALDPNSGSYYYFTLDRTKIVWDNPLNPASPFNLEKETKEDQPASRDADGRYVL